MPCLPDNVTRLMQLARRHKDHDRRPVRRCRELLFKQTSESKLLYSRARQVGGEAHLLKGFTRLEPFPEMIQRLLERLLQP